MMPYCTQPHQTKVVVLVPNRVSVVCRQGTPKRFKLKHRPENAVWPTIFVTVRRRDQTLSYVGSTTTIVAMSASDPYHTTRMTSGRHCIPYCITLLLPLEVVSVSDKAKKVEITHSLISSSFPFSFTCTYVHQPHKPCQRLCRP